MRLIDADAFIRRLRETCEGEDEVTRELAAEIHDLVEIEATFYPIEAEPVRHGKWIYVKGSNGKDYRKCSECLHTQEITGLLNYCPVCGARMDEE